MFSTNQTVAEDPLEGILSRVDARGIGQPVIAIHGARVHNLKNISLDIPRRKFVVVTGVSGSGKSSLAFDTLYAEGQRRYIESLSAYARQFLDQLEKPDVDAIEGLSPAIAIEQATTTHNPRSTVGTVTEIYDFLRLLYARIGKPFCPECGKPISPQTVQAMMDRMAGYPSGTRLSILAPMVRGRKGHYAKELDRLRREGYSRVRIDDEIRDLAEEIRLDRQKKHTIELYVDRLVLKPQLEARIQEALEIALNLGDGAAIVEVEAQGQTKQTLVFHQKFACIECGRSFEEIEPRLFSFNSPYGACPPCEGLGFTRVLDAGLLVPDATKGILEGAIRGIEPRFEAYFVKIFVTLAEHFGADPHLPFEKLPQEVRQAILYGTGKDKITYVLPRGRRRRTVEKPFEGLIPYLERRYRESSRGTLQAYIETFMRKKPCEACKGKRLRKEALCVKLDDQSIADLAELSIAACRERIVAWDLNARERQIAEKPLKEILERLQFLCDVGLEYLSLNRAVSTLSGGEGQRIRLATQIGSELVGVLYVLDEPSIGLHPVDHAKLLHNLCQLRDKGNSVIVVEHDEETMRQADFIVDMGPGAGRNGGEVVVAGSPEEVMASSQSLTGAFLARRDQIALPRQRRRPTGWLGLFGVHTHNLKHMDVQIPLGVLVGVTGVSGSGKSSLVHDTLYDWFRHRLCQNDRDCVARLHAVKGAESIGEILHIDQDPIGRTPRSNPATYTGVFSLIRNFFAALPESRLRGWKPGRFSFNVKGGRCEACQGNGLKRIEMHFLPDVYVHCDLCGGRRFIAEMLEVRYRGASIADVLEMTVADAQRFFAAIPFIRRKLDVLVEVGLGYMTLGQSATSLSGGEAQRMKLSRELAKRSSGKTLYILDEPTTGLHFADIRELLKILQRLVDQGNTVLVIEHNLDVIKSCDWIIDLGPGAGEKGGEIVAAGTPEAVVRQRHSATGRVLAPLLS